jgi:hypothetical protein
MPINDKLYIPKLVNSANRPRPKNISECKQYINDLGDEYSFLEENIKKIKDIEFKFCFYDSSNKKPEIEILKPHTNFTQILTSLLS